MGLLIEAVVFCSALFPPGPPISFCCFGGDVVGVVFGFSILSDFFFLIWLDLLGLAAWGLVVFAFNYDGLGLATCACGLQLVGLVGWFLIACANQYFNCLVGLAGSWRTTRVA
ncbi:MAG: hypothetical protein K8963_09075 [Proteobacteria bacterium]|nr:hypothetical protein [Pseudomonadota bacterium]